MWFLKILPSPNILDVACFLMYEGNVLFSSFRSLIASNTALPFKAIIRDFKRQLLALYHLGCLLSAWNAGVMWFSHLFQIAMTLVILKKKKKRQAQESPWTAENVLWFPSRTLNRQAAKWRHSEPTATPVAKRAVMIHTAQERRTAPVLPSAPALPSSRSGEPLAPLHRICI